MFPPFPAAAALLRTARSFLSVYPFPVFCKGPENLPKDGAGVPIDCLEIVISDKLAGKYRFSLPFSDNLGYNPVTNDTGGMNTS